MKKNRTLMFLGIILLVAFVVRLFFFTGVGSSDSLLYSQFAATIASGESIENVGVSGLRIGFILPLAWIISTFGVNELSINIMNLILGMLSLVLIFLLGKLLYNEKVGLIAALLLSFYPIHIVYSTRLMPDLLAAFFIGLGVYLFFWYEKHRTRWTLLLGGISLGIAYLIKELSILIGLFFLCYIIWKKKIDWWHALVAVGFLLMICVELLFFASAVGDPFHRYSTVQSDWTESIVETNQYGRGDLPEGWLHFFWVMFTDDILGLYYPFIFLALAYLIFYREKKAYPLLLWFIPLIAYFSFGTASPTSYVLIPAAPRMLDIVAYPAMLMIAYFLTRKENIIQKFLKPTMLTLLIITSLGFTYISEERKTLDEEEQAYQFIQTLPPKPIYTDDRSVHIFSYYEDFSKESAFTPFNVYDPVTDEISALDLQLITDSYIVLNREVLNFRAPNKIGIEFPPEIFDVPGSWVKQKFTSGGSSKRIEIYYIP